MADLWTFLIVRLKLWAYSPTVLRDVAVMALVLGQMLLIVRSSEMMRKYRRSIDAANRATQTVLDTAAAWSQRIEEIEQRLAALERRPAKPHYVSAKMLFPSLKELRRANGDARDKPSQHPSDPPP